MFKRINEIKKSRSRKEDNRKATIKVYRRPVFLITGLISLITLTIVIYMIFLNFKEIMRIEYDGYAISGKEITENLLGNSSEEDKNIDLVKVREQDKLYKKLNSYFIGENKKDEINLEYPIYINNNSTIYNLSQNMMLITGEFEEISGYPNLTATNGAIYNQGDLERVDSTEYIFLKNEDNVYTNLKEIKIGTVANEYIIPLNSSIYLDKETIRYYEVKDSKLIFKEIRDIDNNSKVKTGDKEVSYQELLTKLGIIKGDKKETEVGEIIKEDTSEENEKKQEEIKEKIEKEVKQQQGEDTEGKYIRPEVTCSSFKTNVYTMSTNLTIQDPSRVIQSAITFEIKRNGKVYLRKTYTSSGEIQIVGLEPDTNYEIEGTYIYLNEQGKEVENTFYRDSVTTKGLQELKPIRLSFENGEIFSNKMQIAKLKISSNITDEAVKGVKRAEIVIENASYEIKNEKLKQMIAGQEVQVETSESLKSNQKISYEIKFYDKQGNEIKLENNRGESKTAKQKPNVSIRIAKQNVIDVTLGIKLNNKDGVEIQNYRYVITKSNGDVAKESGLKENDNEVYLDDLDPNQYYSIKVYGNYDVNDNKGIQENQVIGETVFATQPLSTLGYLQLEIEQKELEITKSKIGIKIDENRTDYRVIQILNSVEITLLEKKTGQEKYKEKIEREEIRKLKEGERLEKLYEKLESNTEYEIKIIGKVKQGEVEERVEATYSMKSFITLKYPAKVQMKNLFVTADMIDFDIRIEDKDQAILNNKIRMELRGEKENLVKLEYINTNEEYSRKTFEKLEENKNYTLSFYADQYNEGSTDSSYKINYLLKKLEIYTETGITGNIGLTDLTRKAIGKNLIDMSSEIKWYVYPNFGTSDYYGKEYNEESKILTLGGHGNTRRAVYDLRQYAGQAVTMSFKAKLVTETSNVYIQNKKTDGNWTKVEGLTTEWKYYSYTMQLDTSGYLGFYIQGGNGIEIQELQIELGEKKTSYEEYQYILSANVILNLEDKRDELTTNDYYIKVYENSKLIQEKRYEEIGENNSITDVIKSYDVKENNQYKIELGIKINDREYVLDGQEFETNKAKEVKGIRSKEEFLELQPKGNYIVLNDIDLTGGVGLQQRFGGSNLTFDGMIDFGGNTIIRDTKNTRYPIFHIIGKEGKLENLVLEIRLNNLVEIDWFEGFVEYNYGIIKNLQVKLTESNNLPNRRIYLIGWDNYGTLENFAINLQKSIYGNTNMSTTFYTNSGIIKNGYVYGENIKAIYPKSDTEWREIGGILQRNFNMLENVFSLINIEFDHQTNENNANVLADNYDQGIARNMYSVGIGGIKDLNNGPTISWVGSGENKIKNVYYFAEEIFNNVYNTKTTDLALYDTNFQKQVLNGDSQFLIDELVSNGYYPQLDMPDCMPNQEYISLPEVKDKDLADILSVEVLEQGTMSVEVKFRVNNPSAETITNIQVKNLNCEILSQEYEEGISNVIAKLNSPTLCVSSYSVLSITTKGAYNLPYIRKFEENERAIHVELYREVHTIDDWKAINTSPTENYMLMKDLDFINTGGDIQITREYTGKLEGNNHTLKNVAIPDNRNFGLFYSVNGEIRNLNIKNYQKKLTCKVNDAYVGILSICNENSIIDNIHVNGITFIIDSRTIEDELCIGGLISWAKAGATIKNCSISNMQAYIAHQLYCYAGGVIGYSDNSSIENCYVQNLDINVQDTVMPYTGGIVGFTAAKTSNSYAIGNIKSEGANVGGIAGLNKGTVSNCYSFVNIDAKDKNIGGIIGSDTDTSTTNSANNIALGNIYSSVNNKKIGRIIGNSNEEENNYAYNRQRINGYITEEKLGATELLNEEQLKRTSTYSNKLGWSSYDTKGVEQGILPKLYYTNGKDLLPNQQDYLIPQETIISIEAVDAQKSDVNTIVGRIEVNNEKKIEITDIQIEDMESQVTSINNKDGKSYIDFVANPIRYYDSYKIEKIKYKQNGQEQEQEVQGKIEVQFYKELYNYEDWQTIEEGTYQNYRLMNDIDFAGKENVKNNVTMARLEAEGEIRTLKNLKLEFNTNNAGLIKQIKTSLKNIKFEKIEISSTGSGNGMGVILENNGNIKNIQFESLTLTGKKINNVGSISISRGEEANQIQAKDIHIIAATYTGGIFGKIEGGTIENIKGNDIQIESTSNYIGGITGSLSGGEKSVGENITIENSTIKGGSYIGGVSASQSSFPMEKVKVSHVKINGISYVGGIVSYNNTSLANVECDSIEIIGTGERIGGIIGSGGQIRQGKVINSKITGKSNVGGLTGDHGWGIESSQSINNIITALESNVGGISGYMSGFGYAVGNSYVKGGNIQANNNAGGMVGQIKGSGTVYNSYCSTDITAIEENAGGIVGILENRDMTAISNVSKIYNNYIAQSNIRSKQNVGGIIGNITEDLYTAKEWYTGNYVQVELTSEDSNTMSLGIGGRKSQNLNIKNSYYYKYSTINGINPNRENEAYITEQQYLKEIDLKQESTYRNKLKWGNNYLYSTLTNGKYPILNATFITEQEEIGLPKDSEHIVSEETGISLLSLEDEIEKANINSKSKKEKLQEIFEYKERKIETYETYSVITNADGSSVKREERLYVKDGKLYVIDGSLDMVVNNLIVDSYNGKEYETILGTDGKLYDLKDVIHYPENFRNEKIKAIGNNLHKEEKEITVIYENGSKVTFNYQTGEVIEEQKVENNTSLLNYLKEQLETGNNLIENTTENYEENKTLISKLQITPIEKAMELKNNESIDNTVEEQPENTTGISNEKGSITSENRGSYITVYNSSKKEFEVYKEEEILDVKNEEVVSENEKIEKNNLNEYYVQEARSKENGQGLVWISLSITGIVIILFLLIKKNVWRKN